MLNILRSLGVESRILSSLKDEATEDAINLAIDIVQTYSGNQKVDNL